MESVNIHSRVQDTSDSAVGSLLRATAQVSNQKCCRDLCLFQFRVRTDFSNSSFSDCFLAFRKSFPENYALLVIIQIKSKILFGISEFENLGYSRRVAEARGPRSC